MKAQLYAANGSKIGTEIVLDAQSGYSLDVVGLTNGDILFTWVSQGSGRAQIFNSQGVSVGQPFSDSPLAPTDAASLPGGGFIVTWDGSRGGNFAKAYDASGVPMGGAFQISTHDYWDTEIAGLANGGYVARVRHLAQVFNADGTAASKQIVIDSPSHHIDIAALPDGNFVVTWGPDNGRSEDIEAQIFSPSGSAITDKLLVNSITAGWQTSPTIAALGNGGFVISWLDGSDSVDFNDEEPPFGVAAQVFDASGQKVGTQFFVNSVYGGFPDDPVVASFGDDRFVISWEVSGNPLDDHDGYGIMARIYGTPDAPDPVIARFEGTDDIDLFVAPTTSDWTILGKGGNDDLTGNAGDDSVDGSRGNDIINGGAGDDVIIGGGGKDTLSGGEGADIFRFAAGDSKAGGGVRDVITDFQTGSDKLDLSALNVTDFTAQVSYKAVGSGLIVYVDTNNNGFDYSDFGVQLTGYLSLARTTSFYDPRRAVLVKEPASSRC